MSNFRKYVLPRVLSGTCRGAPKGSAPLTPRMCRCLLDKTAGGSEMNRHDDNVQHHQARVVKLHDVVESTASREGESKVVSPLEVLEPRRGRCVIPLKRSPVLEIVGLEVVWSALPAVLRSALFVCLFV
jgi:hypothetical protein